jgi:hypothetical protein
MSVQLQSRGKIAPGFSNHWVPWPTILRVYSRTRGTVLRSPRDARLVPSRTRRRLTRGVRLPRTICCVGRTPGFSAGSHVDVDSSSGSSRGDDTTGVEATDGSGKGRVGVKRLRVCGVKTPAPSSRIGESPGGNGSSACGSRGGLEGGNGSYNASGWPCGRPLAVVVTLDRTLCIGSIPRVESCCVAGSSVGSITAEWHCESRRWIWVGADGGIVTACSTSSACPSSMDLRALVWLRNPLAISKSIADTGDSRRIGMRTRG